MVRRRSAKLDSTSKGLRGAGVSPPRPRDVRLPKPRFSSGKSFAEALRLRETARDQPNVSPRAPVQLVHVVDMDKLEHTSGFEEPGLHDPEVQKSYYFVDTGLIAGNVCLFSRSDTRRGPRREREMRLSGNTVLNTEGASECSRLPARISTPRSSR